MTCRCESEWVCVCVYCVCKWRSHVCLFTWLSLAILSVWFIHTFGHVFVWWWSSNLRFDLTWFNLILFSLENHNSTDEREKKTLIRKYSRSTHIHLKNINGQHTLFFVLFLCLFVCVFGTHTHNTHKTRIKKIIFFNQTYRRTPSREKREKEVRHIHSHIYKYEYEYGYEPVNMWTWRFVITLNWIKSTFFMLSGQNQQNNNKNNEKYGGKLLWLLKFVSISIFFVCLFEEIPRTIDRT